MKVISENKENPCKAAKFFDLFGNPILVVEEEFNKFLEEFRKSELNDDLIKYITAMVDSSLVDSRNNIRKESSLIAEFYTNKIMFLEGARQVIEILKYIASK